MTFRKETTNLAIAALLAFGLAVNISIAVLNKDGFGLDFNQFYSGGRLVGTGHLYDLDALRKVELENGYEMPTGRLPVVLYGQKILGLLPYAWARWTWLAGSIAALLIFAAFWPETRRLPMMVALAWSTPATLILLFGQDDPFWLMSFALGLVLMERKRPWSAGVAFSLCICKFHLTLGIPIMLVAQKRWKTLIAGAVAGSAWIAACFLLEGREWPMQYRRFAELPSFSPAAARMPNLTGIASWFPWPVAIEIVCSVVVVWLLWITCRRSADLGMAGASAAACGLALGHHGYIGDVTLLLPLAILTLQRQNVAAWVKVWTLVILSPVPVALIVSPKPFPGQLLVMAFVVTAMIVAKARPAEQSAPAPCMTLQQSA